MRGLRVLIGPTLAMGTVCLLAAGVLLQSGAARSPGAALYQAYEMLMGEFLQFPAHPLAQAVTVIMPLLGILFVAEGVIKLGFSTFRKEGNLGVWIQMLASTSRQHVILCGLGTVGYRVLEELLAVGEQVFVIERSEHNEFVTLARSKGVEVLIADARAENQLRTLNLDHARAIIIATNDDLANLEIAMDVREMNSTIPIVLRLFDQRLADKVGHLIGIELSVSTSKLAAPLFASAALDKRVVGTHRVGDRLLVVIQARPGTGSPLVGRTIGAISAAHAVTIVGVMGEKGWEIHPDPTAVVQAGRELQIMLPGNRLAETVGWG